MNIRFWAGAAICAVALLPAACATSGPSSAPVPSEGGGIGDPPPEPAVLSPELVAGERVRDIRLSVSPIELRVGESIPFEALDPTPVDADGVPVEDAPLLSAPLQGSVAAMEDGLIVARAEGEAELLLAVMVPAPNGGNEPRIFPQRILVSGAPVTSLEVLPPSHSVYVGTSASFEASGIVEDGSRRSRLSVTWVSRNPEIASVTEGGLVRGHRPGRATLVASAEGVEALHVTEVLENPVRSIALSPGSGSVRMGDVVRFEATPRDGAGSPVRDIPVTYAVSEESLRAGPGASVYPDGVFVAERPGTYRVAVNAGQVSSEAVVEVRDRGVRADAVRVGMGLISHVPTSDLWVFRGRDGRDYAYTGTHAGGQKMFAWDVTAPGDPILTDSVVVDARVVNDVKVNQDATLAVITREGASDRRNGIVILDLEDPAHPEILTYYTEGLTGGVHNTFISGDLVYAVHNGTLDVHIIDISDPTKPSEVGRWGIDVPGKYLHDFWIVDGIGYASYWDDGVWILDVGDGRWGGTPTEPVVISSYAYPEGNTHVAFPYTNADGHAYLFVGDEIFGCRECISRAGQHQEGPRGFVHILSIEDPENPVEVGRYEVPEAGVHNVWAENDRLYVAYYQGGLRVVDISGELRGDLYRQGREIAWLPTGHPDGLAPNAPMAWGPQPYRDHIFVSDMNSGLWVARLVPRRGGSPGP